MYNTYISSAVFTLTTKGSLLLSETFEKNPSLSHCCSRSCCSSCSCCCASSFSTYRLPSVTPSLCYGLRQSTLIQLSPCKRLIFGGRDRYYYRVPSCDDIDHGCFEVSCSFEETGSGERVGRGRRKGGLGGLNLRGRRRCLSSRDDVDDVLSLLSEECLGDGDESGSFSSRVEVGRRSGYRDECRKGGKKNAGLRLLESESKSQYELVNRRNEESKERRRKEERKEYRKEDERNEKDEKEENKSVFRGENQIGRKASSSFSSYYSLSSSGDFESDREAQDEHIGLMEESSSGYKKESQSEENRFRRAAVEENSEQRASAVRIGAEWDLRKKTEKKLTEIEETQSIKDSSQLSSRTARTSEKEYGKGSYKRLDDQNEKSTLEVNFDKETRKKYNQRADRISDQSHTRTDYQEITDTQEIQRKNGKTASQSQRQFGAGEENLIVNANLLAERRSRYHQTASESIGEENLRREAQQSSEMSKARYDDSGRVSHLKSQSESIMSNADQEAIQRIQSRKGSQGIANVSVNVTNVSMVNASDKERSYDSKVTSEKRITDQESKSAQAAKSTPKIRERDNQTNERITDIKSRNESHRTTEVLNFQETTSQEASNYQASLHMVSQARVRQVEEGDYRGSQAMTAAPSRQVLDRDALHVNLTSGLATQEVLGQTSESSSSALYTNSGGKTPTSLEEPYRRDGKARIYGEPLKSLAPEDAIGSAYRLEESSMQYVGEFLETAKHEVSSSEVQRIKKSDQKLVEGNEDKKKNSGHYGSEDLQLKEQNLRRLSGGSGEKGPSDVMWDVTDSSIQVLAGTKAPEGSTTVSNTVTKRTGRSLWSIIGDVVRLRWGSHAETPKSARKSGGKGSSNDSGSEAWFSGRDPEENSDKNVERERRTSKEASSSHHLRQTSSQGQGETSDTISSKSEVRQLEADTSSPSTVWKSGVTSKGISSPSEEENLIWAPDIKNIEVKREQDRNSSHLFPPKKEVGESSSAPPPSTAFVVEESYGRGKTNVSVSGSIEQLVDAKSTEILGPEKMEGELKRRRLQRNIQVPKDRFDEWEEAYIRESEQRKIDEMFMREALLEAEKAADTWEVPVGAVLVQHGKIIARGHNLVEELRDSTAHAELICIREASNQLRTWRLSETTLYVTLEPCAMCAGAILQARIDTLVWGAPNKLLGADGSWIRLLPNGDGGSGSELSDKPPAPVHPFHPNMKVRRGIMASECADVMQQFFQLRRRQKAKNEDVPLNPSLPIASHQSKFLHKMHDIFHTLLCL
ncbi:tRNA(adenine(34)) deaminase, chloroplastic [Mercurialis annua]|uniref:tRNA(adenine(34)) deaminase, chloroplastic n=1 Tax=Mercurialis annua TaxID=3986 RepID=UPI002160A0C3|nr:tRNA(adenine(34)) deaminase, chloroplastic [Mercurialis annua]